MIISKINNELKIICNNSNISFLINKLENIAYDYVSKFEIIPFEFYKKSKSRKWGKVPDGYFMVSDKNKINIYQKNYIYGWIYGAINIRKVATFYLIKPEKVFRPIEYITKNIMETDDRIEMFKDIHVDIRNNFKEDINE